MSSCKPSSGSFSDDEPPSLKFRALLTKGGAQIGDLPILYAGSGDVGLMQKIDEALTGTVMRPSIKVMRREIKKRLGPELRESTQLHAAYSTQENQFPPIAIMLFVGVLDGEPWILEIEKDNLAAPSTQTIWATSLPSEVARCLRKPFSARTSGPSETSGRVRYSRTGYSKTR